MALMVKNHRKMQLTCRLLDCKAKLHLMDEHVSLDHMPGTPPKSCLLCTSRCRLYGLTQQLVLSATYLWPHCYWDQNGLLSLLLLPHHQTCELTASCLDISFIYGFILQNLRTLLQLLLCSQCKSSFMKSQKTTIGSSSRHLEEKCWKPNSTCQEPYQSVLGQSG